MSFLAHLRQALATGELPADPQPALPPPAQAAPTAGWQVPRRATGTREVSSGKVSLAELAAAEGQTLEESGIRAMLEASLEAQGQPAEVQPDLEQLSLGITDVPEVVAETLGAEVGQCAQYFADAARPSPPPLPEPCEIPTTLADLPLFGFICGPAGSGKTWWAKQLAGDQSCPGACVLAATTGIAAVNLGEGTTINALLRYYNTDSLRDAYTSGQLEAILTKLRRLGLQRILLDEVSMMSGDQLTLITHALDNVNRDRADGVPELGMLCIGDFAQLPPVPDHDPADPKMRKKLPVTFAFESPEWERYGANTFTLTKIRRQEDPDFVRALQAVRRGAIQESLAYFAPRLQPLSIQDFPGPTIVAKNDAVDRYNQLRVDLLKGPWLEFPSSRWGKIRADWGGPPKPEGKWEIPPKLRLKEGSRVMILANRNVAGPDEPAEYAYTNGDLGTFLGMHAERRLPVVRLDRTGDEETIYMLTRDNLIPLEPGRRKALREEGHPERVSDNGKYEIVGGITYMPLRLAYASTVHKSQGLSLDQVQVVYRDPFFAQPSMLYVALSRARTSKGLRVVGTPEGFRARLAVNPKVRRWL